MGLALTDGRLDDRFLRHEPRRSVRLPDGAKSDRSFIKYVLTSNRTDVYLIIIIVIHIIVRDNHSLLSVAIYD